MKTRTVKLSAIKPNPNNPRTIKDEKFKKLVQSIQDFPKMLEIRPIVVNSDMIVLGGNMRLKACKEAGLKEVPIVLADDLTEDEQKQFIIKDNVGFGDWDWEQLANEWDAEELGEWGLDVPDMHVETLEAVEDDFNAEPPEEPKTVLGDLYEIGVHRLLCGDSTEIETTQKLFVDELADLVVTDPPYNVDYASKNAMLNKAGKGNRNQTDIQNDSMTDGDFYQFLYDFYTTLGAYTKKGGAWYVWHTDNERINFTKAFEDAGFYFSQCLIWVKNNLVLGRLDYHKKHETCLYGWKEGAGHYFTDERTKTSVIHCDKPFKNADHPTIKPILLLAPLIENSSKVDELIADGFLGSGSTMVAAHQLKRKCYGMELDPKYCDVIINRMLKLDPSLTVKRNGVDVTTDWR